MVISCACVCVCVCACHISELTAKTPVTRLKLVSVTLGWLQNSAGNDSCLELAPPRRCAVLPSGGALLSSRRRIGCWRGMFAWIQHQLYRRESTISKWRTGNHRDPNCFPRPMCDRIFQEEDRIFCGSSLRVPSYCTRPTSIVSIFYNYSSKIRNGVLDAQQRG